VVFVCKNNVNHASVTERFSVTAMGALSDYLAELLEYSCW